LQVFSGRLKRAWRSSSEAQTYAALRRGDAGDDRVIIYTLPVERMDDVINSHAAALGLAITKNARHLGSAVVRLRECHPQFLRGIEIASRGLIAHTQAFETFG